MGVQAANKFGRTGVQFRAFAETVEAEIGEFIGCGRR